MAEPSTASAKDTKETPEPVALTMDLLVKESQFRFGVEPWVVTGALSGKMRGDTMTVDRAQKLIDDFLKTDGSMEEVEA